MSSNSRASLRFGLVLALLALAMACEKRTRTETGAAGGLGERKTLILGLIPEQNIFKQTERYRPIAEYLAAKTGTQVQLTVLPRYGNIIDNFVSAGMDAAFFGSFTYALAHRRLGVEVLARPLDAGGKSTYTGLILVRNDSGITSVEQMEGKRLAFVDRATTAGFLVPLNLFARNGKDYRTFLKESYFAGTHEAAILDVLNGKADIAAAKDSVFRRLEAADPRVGDELTVIEESTEVPENGLAVRRDLDVGLKKALKAALLSMHEDRDGRARLQKFEVERFIDTHDADYQAVYRYAADARLDLANYNYLND